MFTVLVLARNLRSFGRGMWRWGRLAAVALPRAAAMILGAAPFPSPPTPPAPLWGTLPHWSAGLLQLPASGGCGVPGSAPPEDLRWRATPPRPRLPPAAVLCARTWRRWTWQTLPRPAGWAGGAPSPVRSKGGRRARSPWQHPAPTKTRTRPSTPWHHVRRPPAVAGGWTGTLRDQRTCSHAPTPHPPPVRG